jgi:hypothetical protein
MHTLDGLPVINGKVKKSKKSAYTACTFSHEKIIHQQRLKSFKKAGA